MEAGPRKKSSLRHAAARVLFRLAYKIAPERYHPRMVCLPGEHIGRSLVVDGGYEDSLIEIVGDFLKSISDGVTPMHFIDVGANIGTHVVGFARISASLTAFEPNPLVAATLRLNITLNEVRNAEVRELALSNCVQKRWLSVPEANQGNASIENAPSGSDRHELTTSTLDAELAGKFPSRDTLLIKVDVEGHELEVLQGAKELLQTHKSIVVVEYNRSRKSGQLAGFLAEIGYVPAFQVRIPRMSHDPYYRVLSLLGLKSEAVMEPFEPDANYLPAVVFVRT
jgi:FkbM family methyltransferase